MKNDEINEAEEISWKLSNEVVYYTLIRALAHATTGKYSSTVVTELTADEMIRRWGNDKK